MPVPSVKITKLDGNTGVVRPSADGICAIIACAQSGTNNQPNSFGRAPDSITTFGAGNLSRAAHYVMAVAQKPVVLVKGNSGTPGSTGTVVHGTPGTSVVTATGTPVQDFIAIVLTFLTAGTIGVAGITFTYSCDGGLTQSAVQTLGTATTFVVPNTGVTVNFAAGTILAAQTESIPCTGPRMVNADLSAALLALGQSSLPWDHVLILDIDATASTIAIVDAFLAGLEANGQFRTFAMNAIPRVQASQTEAQYLTAMTTAFSGVTTIRGFIGADQTPVPDLRQGLGTSGMLLPQMVATVVSARGMAIDIAIDPAQVDLGALLGCQLVDTRGNPQYHDESQFPGLDDIKLTTLRTFLPQLAGVYVNNAKILSAASSDYVFWQQARVMNRGCTIAYGVLLPRLSSGVQVAQADAQGHVYIAEHEAAEIEQLVQVKLDGGLAGRVTQAKFIVHRTDDLSSNQGAKITTELLINGLRYIKEFDVNSKFVTTIPS